MAKARKDYDELNEKFGHIVFQAEEAESAQALEDEKEIEE